MIRRLLCEAGRCALCLAILALLWLALAIAQSIADG